MISIFIIAKNTFREILRSRILYALFVFYLLMLAFSQILSQLSFAEQERVSLSFSLVAIQLSACILSIFIGASLIFKEIEKKTILTLLVRPLNRLQFLFGKILGLISLIFVLEFIMGILLLSLFYFLNFQMSMHFFVSLYGVFLEALVLSSLALFLSTFSSPYTTVSLSIACFLIGHWMNSFHFFAKKSESVLIHFLNDLLPKVLPNLENFNWRSYMIYKDPVDWNLILKASLYAFSWFFCLMILSYFITRKKDFS